MNRKSEPQFDSSGKHIGTLTITSYSREEWGKLSEAERHGYSEAELYGVEQAEEYVGFGATVRDADGNEYTAWGRDHPDNEDELIARVEAELAAKRSGGKAKTVRALEAPVLKVVGGTDTAPKSDPIGGAAPVAAPFRPVLEAFARTCIGMTGKAALCGYGENPETGKKLRHHIVHVLNNASFVDRACAAIREIASVPGRNVYFPAGLINIDVLDNGNERGKEDSVVGRWCIPLDFDKGNHTAMNVASRLPLPAQVLIQSSVQGIHAIYVLDRPYTVAETQPVLDALVKALGSDPASKGATYVFGLPGTVNWPEKSKREDYAKLGITRVPEMRQAITTYRKSEPVTLADLEAATRKMYPEAFGRGQTAPINSSSSAEAEFNWNARIAGSTFKPFTAEETRKHLCREKYSGDRSKGAFHFMKLCKRRGYSPEQTVELMVEHSDALVMGHYKNAGGAPEEKKLRSDVRRVWEKRDQDQTPTASTAAVFRLSVDRPIEALPELRTITVGSDTINQNVHDGGKAIGEQRLSIFQRGDRLVMPCEALVDHTKGRSSRALRLSRVTPVQMLMLLSAAAQWQRYDARIHAMKPINCPKDVAEAYLDSPTHWTDLRVLDGIVHTPILRADGSILDQPGYDPITRLLFDPLGLTFPAIAAAPSKEDAAAALKLLKELIAETPFASDASLAVGLSALITAVVRSAMRTAPLHATTAPVAGTGKSFLWDLVAMVATGRPAPVISQGGNDEELEKRLVAAMLRGENLISIDNCDRPLGGAFLNMVLTQTGVTARILGQSKNIDIPPNITLLATGNNLRVKDDMPRRVLMCRINTGEENPELRRFKTDPIALIKSHRGRYVAAILTMVRARVATGRLVRQSPLGSFEDWSYLVRDTLLWLGESDPVSTIAAARAGDPDRANLLAALTQWRKFFDCRKVPVREVIERAHNEPDLRQALHAVAAPLVRSVETIDAKRLGEYLAKHEERVLNGMSFKRVGTRDGSALWQLTISQ